ncbi:hypothetical protein [Winogradskyella sp. SYSU M77433]|uniref:tetratricopeptide repeat protein n=1 Tax=Winogradskyella sp. SYSU M77433 TaxID=3042722 RepID=UPI00248104D1|nr:hypothetical protein [Winogradskyella sp. SYSU M77433]MDH7913448.1 hypothetical protein [Winogradskyella sp. SYSU M77433]
MKLSISHELVKSEKYDTAYEPWSIVNTDCPELNFAIYVDGEKILKYKIDNSVGTERVGYIEELLALWQNRSKYYESKTPKGEYQAKACQLIYDYRDDLGKSKQELFACFDTTFETDKETFTHPKSLYTYFSLVVDLYEKGEKTAAELFNTYDNINEKIQLEIQNYSEKLNVLLQKQENGEALNKTEKANKRAYESYLKNYTIIEESIDAISSSKANCDNLIPLYTKDFNANKDDSVWLKRAVSRMYHKECTDHELYEKLVKQYDQVSPSADTKIYVATVLLKKGKNEEAYKYLEEGYRLETDTYKKSNLAIRIGVIFKSKGQYTKARNFLQDAVKLNPSNGRPHLIIADMYSDSAKNCGKDNFYQRAVFWLAAKEAEKAARLDPTLQKTVSKYVASYEAKVPTKEEIFLREMSGKTIEIGCWINRSIVVP